MLHWFLQLIRYTFKDACSTASLKLRYANVDAPLFVRDAIGNRSGSIIMLLGKVIYIRLPLNIYSFANEYVLPFLRFIIVVAGMSCKEEA